MERAEVRRTKLDLVSRLSAQTCESSAGYKPTRTNERTDDKSRRLVPQTHMFLAKALSSES
jgi:hypothetical protein